MPCKKQEAPSKGGGGGGRGYGLMEETAHHDVDLDAHPRFVLPFSSFVLPQKSSIVA